MNKICTSLEQSKKLIELGIDMNTADMWYHGHGSPLKSEREYDSNACPFHSMRPNWDIPAWSLSALLELIPNYVINKSDDKVYANLYYDSKSSYDNLVNAAFELICRLKENGKL